MGLLTTRSTRRLATVGGLLTLALVAGAAPAVAAQPPPAPGCVGVGDRGGQGPVARLLAALGVTVTLDVQAARAPRARARTARPHRAGPPGTRRSAAALQNWGEPTRVEEFDGTRLGPAWDVYDGPGHAGNGRRTPSAVSVRDGILTITGNPAGDTAGMEWGGGQRYGRWEGRVTRPGERPVVQRAAAAVARRRELPGRRRDRLHGDDGPHPAEDQRLPALREEQQADLGQRRRGRHAVAQLGRRVDADLHRDVPRRQAVVAHRAHGDLPARADAPVHPARLVPPVGPRPGEDLDDAGRLGEAVRAEPGRDGQRGAPRGRNR